MHASMSRSSKNMLIAIFTFLAVAICTGGYMLYLHQKKIITLEKYNELAAINKLKIAQIVNWRNTLLSNSKTIFYNQLVVTHIQELNFGITTKINYQTISNWSKSLLKEFENTKLLLVNPSDKAIINTNPNEPLTETGKRIIAQAIQNKDIVISNFSRYNNKTICIYIAIPLYLKPDMREGFSGVALLNIDPTKYLYQLSQSWPSSNLTVENLPLCREGDSVLYLNELHHYKNSALRLSSPMTGSKTTVIRAILSNGGMIEGLDYRGINVLAVAESVPDTQWFIVSKIDTKELYQPIRNQAILVVCFIFILIFICALAIYLKWKSQSIKSEKERQALVKHFEYLVKYTNDIIILSDFNGNINEVNDKTIKEYGYSRAEILKMNIKQLSPTETDDAMGMQPDLIHKNDGSLIETLHIRKNGEKFPVEISGRIIEVDGIKYYQAIIRDITERKKTEADLIKAKEKAEESDRLKTAFLNNMSHEIRTPMNGILGFAEFLDDETLSQEERRQYISIINNNSLLLLSIINDIIDISEIDSNQLTLSNVSFNLNHMLDELLITIEHEKALQNKTGLTLSLDKSCGEYNFTIISDDVRIKQILYNLLNNAMKFTQKGFIKFGYTATGDTLKFFVQDTGKGIPKDKQSLIFERFRQEEETYTRHFGGTGLGLSISKGLVELLGGNMWLDSDEGIGTSFYFTIPYIPLIMKPVISEKIISQRP